MEKVNIVCDDSKSKKPFSDEEQLDIAQNVGNAVADCMQKFVCDSQKELEELRQQQWDADKLIEALREKFGHYRLFCGDDLKTYLEEFPYQEIKSAFNCRLFYQMWLSLYDCYGEYLLKIIEFYENKFASEMDAEESDLFLLIRGNCYAKLGKKEQAAIYYREGIKAFNKGTANAGWSYQGLSNLYDFSDKRRIPLLQSAAEEFLLCGDLENHIKVNLKLITYYLHFDRHHADMLELMNKTLEVVKAMAEAKKDRGLYPSVLSVQIEVQEALEDHKGALESTDEALKLYENTYGQEMDYIAFAQRGVLIADLVGRKDKAAEYRKIISRGEQNIVINAADSRKYEKRKVFLENLRSGNYSELSADGYDDEDKELMWSAWIMESVADGLSDIERVRKLQKALDYVEAHYPYRVDYLEIIYMRFADIYKEIDAGECISWCEKVLDINIFNHSARELYVKNLVDLMCWEELQIFSERILKIEEDDNYFFLAGYAYYKRYHFDDALKFLSRIQEPGEDVKKIIMDCVSNGGRVPNPVRNTSKEVSLDALENALRDFSKIIENEQRMNFFRADKDQPHSHKWISHPEQLAQTLLHMNLKTAFGGDIKIFEELDAGAGRIDLYLQLASDRQVIIELKMCGNGYSSEYAQSGMEQLYHYMRNRGVKVGYLVVFDARKRDFGMKVSPCYVPEEGIVIRSIFVDMRAEVKYF